MARAAGRQAIKPARRKVAGTSRKAVPTATAEAATPAPESPPAPASPAASALCPTPERGPWAAADAAVVGVAHLRAAPPTPCQDAALAEAGPRPIALVCDGAGSAPVSHLGATAVGIAIRRLCRTLEYDIAAALDHPDTSPGSAGLLARRIVAHAQGTLEDLAARDTRDVGDFRCTLLVWIAGRQRSLWVKVGDGALIYQSSAKIACIGPVGKGEFANQTCFISPRLEESQWAWGEIDAREITGLAAMSDGAAERLVASDATRVAPALGKLLCAVADGSAGRRDLFGVLAEAAFWRGTTGDDKSLALLART